MNLTTYSESKTFLLWRMSKKTELESHTQEKAWNHFALFLSKIIFKDYFILHKSFLFATTNLGGLFELFQLLLDSNLRQWVFPLRMTPDPSIMGEYHSVRQEKKKDMDHGLPFSRFGLYLTDTTATALHNTISCGPFLSPFGPWSDRDEATWTWFSF